MKKRKGLKAAVIMTVLSFAVTCTAYGDLNATQLTDIDKSWAKQNIASVYEKGLMDAAADGLFKPAENTRNYDAIVGIGRMMNAVYKADLDALKAKYKDRILDKFNVPENIRGEVALCLEKNVITDYDISAFQDSPYAKKKDVCMYLGKAFGITVKANMPPTILPAFTDVLFIPTAYKPYVKYLIDIGVIGEKGDANGKLNPDAMLTRETFAKMLDISNTQFQKEKLGGGAGTGTTEDTSVVQDNNAGSGSSQDSSTGTSIGSNTATDTAADTPAISIESEGAPDITGYVEEVIAEYGNLAVSVKDAAGTLTKKVYRVSESVVCSLDGAQVNYYKLKKDDVANLYLNNNVITKIIAESKVRKMVGELMEIDTTDKTVLTMKTHKGEIKNYTITTRTVVVKDGKVAGWQDLNKGNKLLLTSSYDELLEVNADGIETNEKGVIESITYSRTTTPKLVLTTAGDLQSAYYTAKTIEVAGTVNDVYGLRPGMLVDVQIIDEEVVKVTIVNEIAAVSIDTKGAVKFVNAELKIITISEYNAMGKNYVEKKVFAGNAKIVDKKLSPVDIMSIKEGTNLIIIGTEGLEGISADTVIVDL